MSLHFNFLCVKMFQIMPNPFAIFFWTLSLLIFKLNLCPLHISTRIIIFSLIMIRSNFTSSTAPWSTTNPSMPLPTGAIPRPTPPTPPPMPTSPCSTRHPRRILALGTADPPATLAISNPLPGPPGAASVSASASVAACLYGATKNDPNASMWCRDWWVRCRIENC